tara:strand:+ start:359 stop:1615 length:1257 start_codon:yes stop_codon:yes gene_type:complete
MPKQNKLIENAITTEDLWRIMLKRVPPIVSEYFRGGADSETTMRGNVKAFQQSATTARGAIKFDKVDLTTNTMGQKLNVPWYISPVGSLRSLYPMADAVASKVAGEYGTIMAQSTLSGTPMEEVTKASKGACWYQLYLCGGKETALRSINRANEAGFTGLILTIDTGVSGLRALHQRMNPMQVAKPFTGLGLVEAIRLIFKKISVAPQMVTRLPWLIDHTIDGGLMEFVNVVDENGYAMPYADIGEQLSSSAVTWDDLNWIKQAWGNEKPLIIKGIHCSYDAKKAEDYGASGVIWSNHGGRQQDRVPPTLHIVEQEMPHMANSSLDFMMDGGIRNGTDILIALSYGLKAVGIGRVTAAGIGAGGALGLRRAFDILDSDLRRAMRLVGLQNISEIQEMGSEVRRKNLLIGDSHLPEFVY